MQKRWKGSRKYEANFERKAYNQRGKYQSCLSWGYLQTLCTWVSVQGTLEMMDTEVKVKIFQGTLPTSRWCLKGYALGITVLGIGFLNAAGMTVWLNSCQWDIGKICWAVSRKTFLPSERERGCKGIPFFPFLPRSSGCCLGTLWCSTLAAILWPWGYDHAEGGRKRNLWRAQSPTNPGSTHFRLFAGKYVMQLWLSYSIPSSGILLTEKNHNCKTEGLPTLTSITHPSSESQGQPICEFTGFTGRTRKVREDLKPLSPTGSESSQLFICLHLLCHRLMTFRVKGRIPLPVSVPLPCGIWTLSGAHLFVLWSGEIDPCYTCADIMIYRENPLSCLNLLPLASSLLL